MVIAPIAVVRCVALCRTVTLLLGLGQFHVLESGSHRFQVLVSPVTARCPETERPYAVAALPYPFTAFSIPEPASARSLVFIAGRTVSFALNARNHGSAIAGSCEDSFMSKNMSPVRSPLSSEK